MEVKALAKNIRVQPRKVRLLSSEIKGKNAAYSASRLQFHKSKGARVLRKVILSAIANAVENHGMSDESLYIRKIEVDEGPRYKRIQARAMGRANRILKRTSHIAVFVEEQEKGNTGDSQKSQSKAKKRPVLAKGTAKTTKKVATKAPKDIEAKSPEIKEEVTKPAVEENAKVEADQVAEAPKQEVTKAVESTEESKSEDKNS